MFSNMWNDTERNLTGTTLLRNRLLVAKVTVQQHVGCVLTFVSGLDDYRALLIRRGNKQSSRMFFPQRGKKEKGKKKKKKGKNRKQRK